MKRAFAILFAILMMLSMVALFFPIFQGMQ